MYMPNFQCLIHVRTTPVVMGALVCKNRGPAQASAVSVQNASQDQVVLRVMCEKHFIYSLNYLSTVYCCCGEEFMQERLYKNIKMKLFS